MLCLCTYTDPTNENIKSQEIIFNVDVAYRATKISPAS